MDKKLCGIIRALLFMMKKGLLKKIPWFELHMLLKKSTKTAGKTLSCRPNNIHTTFIAPVEYQFSCSDTPLFNYKRKNNRYYHSYSRSHKETNQLMTVDDVKKAFDVLNYYETATFVDQVEKSPLTLLGFGVSPNVRRLRVSDSPFPEYNTEEDVLQVDKAADEFINNFYKELKQEKKRAIVERPSPSPSPLYYRKWG